MKGVAKREAHQEGELAVPPRVFYYSRSYQKYFNKRGPAKSILMNAVPLRVF